MVVTSSSVGKELNCNGEGIQSATMKISTLSDSDSASPKSSKIGGSGKIETQKSLVTEVPIRGFYSYYCELMGFTAGVEAAAE